MKKYNYFDIRITFLNVISSILFGRRVDTGSKLTHKQGDKI